MAILAIDPLNNRAHLSLQPCFLSTSHKFHLFSSLLLRTRCSTCSTSRRSSGRSTATCGCCGTRRARPQSTLSTSGTTPPATGRFSTLRTVSILRNRVFFFFVNFAGYWQVFDAKNGEYSEPQTFFIFAVWTKKVLFIVSYL